MKSSSKSKSKVRNKQLSSRPSLESEKSSNLRNPIQKKQKGGDGHYEYQFSSENMMRKVVIPNVLSMNKDLGKILV